MEAPVCLVDHEPCQPQCFDAIGNAGSQARGVERLRYMYDMHGVVGMQFTPAQHHALEEIEPAVHMNGRPLAPGPTHDAQVPLSFPAQQAQRMGPMQLHRASSDADAALAASIFLGTMVGLAQARALSQTTVAAYPATASAATCTGASAWVAPSALVRPRRQPAGWCSSTGCAPPSGSAR